MVQRRATLLRVQDHLRRGVVLEPRGHSAIVGALPTPPEHSTSDTGVIFFNDVGGLGMCGHGLMGLARSLCEVRPELAAAARERPLRIDTAVGTVEARVEPDSSFVEIENVPCRCYALGVRVEVPGIGIVEGDIAYGGNWFFLTSLEETPLDYRLRGELLAGCSRIRDALRSQGITGDDGADIDHIELFGPPRRPDADARNFVLCPGDAYDRSPCGTGTSAKMAALHARGLLRPGERWRQESITGSLFEGRLEERDGMLIPRLRGSVFLTARSTLLFPAGDPFRFGM